jgi:hypothetical protein
MNQEERNQALLVADGLFEKARKIEKRINWNNDAERDLALNKLGQIFLNAHWELVKATSNKGV